MRWWQEPLNTAFSGMICSIKSQKSFLPASFHALLYHTSLLLLLQESGPIDKAAFDKHLAVARSNAHSALARELQPLLVTLTHRYNLLRYDTEGPAHDILRYLADALNLHHGAFQQDMRDALACALRGEGAAVAHQQGGFAVQYFELRYAPSFFSLCVSSEK
jgi:hypothetical protein